jgi:hypothetical protein
MRAGERSAFNAISISEISIAWVSLGSRVMARQEAKSLIARLCDAIARRTSGGRPVPVWWWPSDVP